MLSLHATISRTRSGTVRTVPAWSAFSGVTSSPTLSDSFSVTVVPAASVPSARRRSTSARTASLMTLAVGKRASAFTAKASPVSRLRA